MKKVVRCHPMGANIFHILLLTGKVLYDKVGDWHFDKRQYDPTPVPRDMKQPAATVNFPLAREFVRCIYICVCICVC